MGTAKMLGKRRVHPALPIALLALLVLSCRVSAPSCAVCDREECANLAFTIALEEGGKVETCCPRCGLHYVESETARRGRPVQVASLRVRDFDTSRPLDAWDAVYVEGSDVAPCLTEDPSLRRDDRGCCLRPVYDRCLPSLIAFGTEMRAREFARENGGILRSFEELRPAAMSGSAASRGAD